MVPPLPASPAGLSAASCTLTNTPPRPFCSPLLEMYFSLPSSGQTPHGPVPLGGQPTSWRPMRLSRVPTRLLFGLAPVPGLFGSVLIPRKVRLFATAAGAHWLIAASTFG